MMHGRALHHHCRKPNYTRIETCEERSNVMRFTGKYETMRVLAQDSPAQDHEDAVTEGRHSNSKPVGVAVCEFVHLLVNTEGKDMWIEQGKKNNELNQSIARLTLPRR